VLCAPKTYLAIGLPELSNSLLDALTSRVKQANGGTARRIFGVGIRDFWITG
jgi:hypothetical protein